MQFKRFSVTFLVFAMILLTGYLVVSGAIPHLINYQGKLTDHAGDPVTDGTYALCFKIYGSELGTDSLWWECHPNKQVTNGIFSVILGTVNPINLSFDSQYWLEVKVDAETITPRRQLTSIGYSFTAQKADTADFSLKAGSIMDDSVTSAKIQNGTIQFEDIGQNGASENKVMKWKGGAWIAANDSTGGGGVTDHGDLTGLEDDDHPRYLDAPGGEVSGTVIFNDSTMVVGQCVVMGQVWSGNEDQLLYMERDWNTSDRRKGIYVYSLNNGTGEVFGIDAVAHNADGSSHDRYGVKGRAGYSSNTGGASYGVYGSAWGGQEARGIYGHASGASGQNYAGKFNGDVDIDGHLTKTSGAFRIDHPLDPENKYLQHSFVESPDMMNVYNGNATLDANGEATVQLPEYFEALNKDFRYQLTAVGAPAPNLYIAKEISDNRFLIAGGEPSMKVSWQVTGIRHDKWAESNRIQVEIEKEPYERGLYRHPELYGFGEDKAIDKEPDLKAERNRGPRRK